MSTAQLFLVGIPIGNAGDLTLRARACLEGTDLWIGECRQGLAALKQMCQRTEIANFHLLDRHTSPDDVEELVELILAAQKAVLVSDAGMPAIADPGVKLAQACLRRGIQLIPIPGVSSILAALVVSGFALNHWYYAGFLPRGEGERKQAITALNEEPLTTVLMETPYRLLPLLKDLAAHLTAGRQVILAWQMTCPDERILRGTASEILSQVSKLGFEKGEFVVVIDSH